MTRVKGWKRRRVVFPVEKGEKLMRVYQGHKLFITVTVGSCNHS